jgi:drug/metabolite transporter (DMT)-like permease
VRVLIGLGMAMGLTSVLYTYAVQHATAATAVLLNNSSPLYVALFSPWLLREPRPRATWISLGLAALGVALLTGLIGQPSPARQLRGDATGIVAALASGFMYALPIMIGRHLRGKVGSMTQIWWGSGVAALMLLPVALGTTSACGPQPADPDPTGVVALGLPYLLVFQGLQRISAQSASITALLEPVSGVLSACWSTTRRCRLSGWSAWR